MTVALMVSLLASTPAPPAAVRSDDPPVQVSLNQDSYFQRGDRARVHVRVRDDGYLVVLRADADGRVRVLFPLDPGDDAFVRGGRKIEVRGRGDREAFYVDEREGSGVVLAAHSATPFRFDEFVRGDHWDYRVLDASRGGGGGGDDKETALVDMVHRMLADGSFEYDVVSYTVEPPGAHRRYRTHYSSIGLRVGFGYGWPRHRYGFSYGSCYDPFFYDPWYCGRTFYDPFFYDAFFYDPFFYGGYGYYRPYRPIIYGGGVVIYTRPRYRSRLFIDRVRPSVGSPIVFRDRAAAPTVLGVEPRLRIPQGTLLNRTTRVRSVPVSAPTTSAPVRQRDIWSDRARSTPAPAAAPARERPSAPERRPAADRGSDRRDGSRDAAAPAQRSGERGADRAAPQRSADRGVSRGGGGSGGGGGGGKPSSSAGGSSGSSGSSRGSAPANGGVGSGGRRRS
jgi:uncharacterized protein DUF4384